MVNEYQRRIRQSISQLQESTILENGDIEGCDREEIQEIEQKEDVSLPAAYVLFLQEIGKSAGDFLRGDDLYFPEMIGLKNGANELIEESNAAVELTDSEFVFAGHHDYVYLYFDTNHDEDPPVYRYVEGDENSEKVFEHFSEWVESSVQDEISLAEY